MANAAEYSLRKACYRNWFRVSPSANIGALTLGGTAQGYVSTAGGNTAAICFGIGTSSSPVTTTTADKNFVAFYTKTAATSGDSRALRVQMVMTGSGVDGEALRVVSDLQTNSPGSSSAVNGSHITLQFGSSAGNLSGTIGSAVKATLAAPNRQILGNAASIIAEMNAGGASASCMGPTGTQTAAFVRFSLTGTAGGIGNLEDYGNLFYLDGFTSGTGNIYFDKTLRCSAAGTSKFLVMSDSENGLAWGNTTTHKSSATAGVNHIALYTDCSATSGNSYAARFQHYIIGAAGSGAAVRAYGIAKGASAYTLYGVEATAEIHSAGSSGLTGEMSAIKATATVNTSTVAVVSVLNLTMSAAASKTMHGDSSFIRVQNAGDGTDIPVFCYFGDARGAAGAATIVNTDHANDLAANLYVRCADPSGVFYLMATSTAPAAS